MATAPLQLYRTHACPAVVPCGEKQSGAGYPRRLPF